MSRALGSKVLVTGGSGFLGRNLIRALVHQGAEVHALSRSVRAAGIIERVGGVAESGDLDDPAALRRCLRGAETVFHAAAYVGQWGPPGVFDQVNVQGTLNVLDAARECGVKRLLFVSTEAVLADGRPIVGADETVPIPRRPLPGYPRSKAEAERAVLAANGDALTTVVVRPRLVWGRDDTTILPELAQAVTTGRFAWIAGGRYPTSTCHVVNACHGAILAAESGKPGSVYFLTDGEPVQLRAFFTSLLATRGLTPGDRSVPRWLARCVAFVSELVNSALSLEAPPAVTRTAVALLGQEVTVKDDRARQEIGYAPVISREEGFSELTTGRWKEESSLGAA